ncbi:MAG: hypothetical protein AAFX45_03265 [Pseudomonadota bacterium]
MSFVRPELQAVAWRWRETLVGAAGALLGGYLALTGTLAAQIIGAALIIGGALLGVAGVQRARFRRGGLGLGVVSLDEGRLAYFGPTEGGVIAVAALSGVDLMVGSDTSVWELEAADGSRLAVPLDAAGAEVLFDVFGGLPGLNTASMLSAVEAARPGRTMIWAKAAGTARVSAH